jgi:phage tail protein X
MTTLVPIVTSDDSMLETVDRWVLAVDGESTEETVALLPSARPQVPIIQIAFHYRTADGDMLDLICWAAYGRQSGAVERVLDASPGLADRGPIYPAGVLITLPETVVAPVAQPARLWD